MDEETIVRPEMGRYRDDDEFTLNRRAFLQTLGAGLLITVTDGLAWGQRGGGRSEQTPVAARIHLNEDGTITALSGKVDEGQGARTQLSQAAAEELRVPVERIRLIMADTDFVPDDGITAGQPDHAAECAPDASGGRHGSRTAHATGGQAVAGGCRHARGRRTARSRTRRRSRRSPMPIWPSRRILSPRPSRRAFDPT